MRILVIPTISKKKDVGYESCFIVFYTLARAMPEHFFYILLSKTADIEQFKLPNVQYMKLEDNVEYNSLHSYFPSEILPYFHRSYGKYPIDLVVTTRSPIGTLIKKRFSSVRSGANAPVTMFITKALGKGSTHDMVTEIDLKMRGLSYTECPTQFLTSYEKKIALDSMNQYFSGTSIMQASMNGKVLSQGMDVDRIENVIAGIKKRERFTYYFGGRFVTNKRWEECLSLLRELKITDGGRSEIEVTTPAGAEGSRDISEYDSIPIHYGLSQDDLFKLQAQCHAAISWSEFEGLPIGFVEQILCGLILICVRRQWSEAVFGKDYPFFFGNKQEAWALFKYVNKNYESAVKQMKPFKDKLRHNNDIQNTRKELNDWWKNLVEGTYFDKLVTGDFQTILDAMPSQFSFATYIETLFKLKPGYKMGLSQEYVGTGTVDLSRRDLYYWLTKHAKDLLNSADPIFVKV